MTWINNFIRRLAKRLTPFLDLTAWVLLVISFGPLAFVGKELALTVGQWTVYALAFAGVAIVITRLMLPIDLREYLERARDGNTAAAIVVMATALLLGIAFIGITLWARS